MENVAFDPRLFFAATFGLSCMCGLAAWYRSGDPATIRNIGSSMLNGGCVGLGLALVGFRYFHDEYGQWLLMGICMFSGLGGPSMADLAGRILRAVIYKFFSDKGIQPDSDADSKSGAKKGEQ